MAWSSQQEAALKAVSQWLGDPSGPQVFRLFGYAGTGKTTLAKAIRNEVNGKVFFGAFTGKAALVLQTKGCRNASTIHSMIYKLEGEDGGQPTFVLDKEAAVKKAKLVIIDECSMVDEELGKDLLSYGVRVLVIGDPAQLPPVSGAGFFTNHRPNIMLTEVHRQARDNPIIRMSMDVREGGNLEPGTYGESRIVKRSDIDAGDVMSADQVLVGLNKTRHAYNGRIRALKEIESDLPVVGERLVCLRNNREKGLLNGGLWTVEKIVRRGTQAIKMVIEPLDAGATKQSVKASVHPYFFQDREKELTWPVRRESDEFNYGYALTVHKSQGSQWDSVMLFNESASFREDARRWLYTGLTRAAEKITVVV